MAPSPPKPPAPLPPPPTVDQARQQADATDLLRRRRGYGATVLSQPGPAQTRLGTSALMSGGANRAPLGAANAAA